MRSKLKTIIISTISFLLVYSTLLYSLKKSHSVIKDVSLNVSSQSIYDIISDYNNNVHLIWKQNDCLYYGKIVKTEVKEITKIPDSCDFIVKFTRPRITVRPDGKSVHIVWQKGKPGSELIHVWRDKTGWHREVVWKSSNGYYVAAPIGGEDLSGTLHIIAQVWKNDSNNFHTKIKYWFKAPGSGWNAGWTMLESPKKWKDTHMFFDKEGGIHAVYKSGSTPGKYVYAQNGKLLKDSEQYNIPLPAVEGVKSIGPGDIFVDNEKIVHHAFVTFDKMYIYYAKRVNGEWIDYQNLSENEIAFCHEFEPWPTVAKGPDGTIYVAWADMKCPHKEVNRVFLAKKAPGEEWKKEILTEDAAIDEWGKVAITSNEKGVYIIYRHEKDEKLMLHAILEKYVMPPLNATYKQITKRSIFYIVYSNKLKWEPNPENKDAGVKIKKYKIYYTDENGKRKLLAEVSGDTYEYLHFNVKKDFNYKYAISSVDEDGEESEKVSFSKEE